MEKSYKEYMNQITTFIFDVDGVLTEDVNPNPKTVYGKSKLAAELYILSKEIPKNKRVYILRPCMIHGPKNKGNLNLLYSFVSRGIPYPFGKYTNSRSFVSIENLCFIINELIDNTHQAGKQSWKKAKEKVGKEYQKNTDNLVDPNATEWEKTVAALEEGASKTADLDVQILKEGVIDQAMSRRVMKAKDAVIDGKMTEEAFEELYATALQMYNYTTNTAGNLGRALKARQMFTADGSTSLKTIKSPVLS